MRTFLLILGGVLNTTGLIVGFAILMTLGMGWLADYIWSDMTTLEKFNALYYAETSPEPLIDLGPLTIGHGIVCVVLYVTGLACLYAAHRINKSKQANSPFTSRSSLGC